MSFGERIKQAREEKNLTQQDIADKMFVSRQTISRWEKEDRFPDLITAKKVADFLELSLDDILSDRELKSVAEKEQIINDGLINRIIIVLFACVVITLTTGIIDVFIRLPLQKAYTDLPLDRSYIRLLTTAIVSMVIRDVAFVFGLVAAIRKNLSPWRSGFIIILFFATGCFVGVGTQTAAINQAEPLSNIMLRIILPIVPNIIGAVSAYMFFFDKKLKRPAGMLLIVVSLISICIFILRTGLLYSLALDLAQGGEAGSMTLVSGADILLNIGLCLLFIYQVIILSRKRRRLENVT